MPTSFECRGKIPGRKLVAVFAYDYDVQNQMITFERENFDFHFGPLLKALNENPRSTVFDKAVDGLNAREFGSAGYTFYAEEAIAELNETKPDKRNQITVPSACIKAVMMIQEQAVAAALLGGNEDEMNMLKPIVKNLSIDGKSAVDLLGAAAFSSVKEINEVKEIKEIKENKNDMCQGMERFENLAPWQRKAFDYE